MSGGSTNGVLHLLAVASEAGIELTIDDFDRISERTPLLGDLKPGGRFVASDLNDAGGVGVLAKRLDEAGLLHRDAITVTGRTIGEEADAAEETEGQEVVRPLADPLKETGGLVILRGNLAPDGCVVKVAGYERLDHTGPAKVFESEEECFAAVKDERDQGRRRGRDPQRGPLRRPRHARDAPGDRGAGGRGARRQGRAAHRRPLLRRHPRADGRPRRPRGGPRRADRRVRDGDEITLDIDGRRSRSTSPTTRSRSGSRPYEPPEPLYRAGVMAKYAASVSRLRGRRYG